MGFVRLVNLCVFIFTTYVFGILICKEYAEYKINKILKPVPYTNVASEAQNNATFVRNQLNNRADL